MPAGAIHAPAASRRQPELRTAGGTIRGCRTVLLVTRRVERVSETTWNRHRETRRIDAGDGDRFVARYPNGKIFLFWREGSG